MLYFTSSSFVINTFLKNHSQLGFMTKQKPIKTLLLLGLFSVLGFFISFTEVNASENLRSEYLHRVDCNQRFEYHENQVDYYKSRYPQSSAGMVPESFADLAEINLSYLIDGTFPSVYISYPVTNSKIKERKKWESMNNVTEKNLILALNTALEESSERYLPRKITFLEIGSNLGWYSAIFASKGYSTVTIDSNSHAKLVQKNVCQNQVSNVSKNEVYFLGLKKYDEKCALLSSRFHFVYFMNNFDWCQTDKPSLFEMNQKQKLHILSIDAIISAHQAEKRQIAVVKIDAKGTELDILKGGQYFFKNTPPLFIFIETSKKFTTNMKSQLYTLMLYLTNDLGYRLFEDTPYDKYIPYYDYSNYVQNLHRIPNLCAVHNSFYEVKLEGEYK